MFDDIRRDPVSGRQFLSNGSTINVADWIKQQRDFDIGWNIAKNGAVRMSRARQDVDQNVIYAGFRVADGKRFVVPALAVVLSEGRYLVQIVRIQDGFSTNGDSEEFYKAALCEEDDLSVAVQGSAWLDVTPDGSEEVLQEAIFDIGNEPGGARPASATTLAESALVCFRYDRAVRIERLGSNSFDVSVLALAWEVDR